MKCAANTNIFTEVFNEHVQTSSCCGLELQITLGVCTFAVCILVRYQVCIGVKVSPDPQQTENTTRGGTTQAKLSKEDGGAAALCPLGWLD